MPFFDSNLLALDFMGQPYLVAAVNGLFVDVYPGSGKYFILKYRFPPRHSGL